MALADNAARKAGEKLPAFKPAAKKFDWAEGYMDFVMSGGQADAMTMGGATQGKDLVQSGINIGQGKGSAGDYLTVGLAPLALAGFGAGGAAAKGVSAADNALARLLATRVLKNPNVSVRFPSNVSSDLINSGRFKNSTELGIDSGFSVISPQARINAENLAYGIPLTANAADRPIYGMLTANKQIPSTRLLPETAKLSQATRPAPTSTGYGDAVAVFKNPSGKFSGGDSYSSNPGQSWNLGQVPAEFADNPAMAFRSDVDRLFTGADDAYRAATRQRPQSLEAAIPAKDASISNVDYFLVDSKAKKNALQILLKKQGYSTKVRLDKKMNKPVTNKFSLPNLPSLNLSKPPQIPGFERVK